MEWRAGARRTHRRPSFNDLNTEINAVLKDPDVLQKMNALGFELVGGTPEELSALIKSESEKWVPVIKKAGVKIE